MTSEAKIQVEVREAHLRAFLNGETIITPLELRAVVKAAIRTREEELQGARTLLQNVSDLFYMVDQEDKPLWAEDDLMEQIATYLNLCVMCGRPKPHTCSFKPKTSVGKKRKSLSSRVCVQPADTCAYPTGCTKKRLRGLSFCRQHQPYPAK